MGLTLGPDQHMEHLPGQAHLSCWFGAGSLGTADTPSLQLSVPCRSMACCGRSDSVIFPGAPDFLAHVRKSSRFECTHFSSYLEYSQLVDGLEKAVYMGLGSLAEP